MEEVPANARIIGLTKRHYSDKGGTFRSSSPPPDRTAITRALHGYRQVNLSALGVVHFAVFGKEHWAIGAFLRTWFRQLPDTGQAPCGGPGTPAALTGRSGSRS